MSTLLLPGHLEEAHRLALNDNGSGILSANAQQGLRQAHGLAKCLSVFDACILCRQIASYMQTKQRSHLQIDPNSMKSRYVLMHQQTLQEACLACELIPMCAQAIERFVSDHGILSGLWNIVLGIGGQMLLHHKWESSEAEVVAWCVCLPPMSLNSLHSLHW